MLKAQAKSITVKNRLYEFLASEVKGGLAMICHDRRNVFR